MIGEKQEIVDVIGREYLGLFTGHLASIQLLDIDSRPTESECNGKPCRKQLYSFR
jgi:hypothetical protein